MMTCKQAVLSWSRMHGGKEEGIILDLAKDQHENLEPDHIGE